MAIWLTPLAGADGLDGDAELAAELVARGVVEGSYDPKSIYRDQGGADAPRPRRCAATGATSPARRSSAS